MNWKLVPETLTEPMSEVLRNEKCVYQSEQELYDSLLAAAPAAPVELEPVAWVDDIKATRPRCVTNLDYRSVTEAKLDVKYTPLYLAPPPAVQEDYFADACRLAMELECLLLDCKDTVITAKWWESANEALDQHRERIEQMRKEQE